MNMKFEMLEIEFLFSKNLETYKNISTKWERGFKDLSRSYSIEKL